MGLWSQSKLLQKLEKRKAGQLLKTQFQDAARLPYVLSKKVFSTLLHVGNFAVHERDLHIFVDEDLLRGQFHNLIGLAQSVRDLVGSHANFHGLRIGLLLLILASAVITAGLLLALIPALLIVALLIVAAAIIVAQSEDLRDCVFHFPGLRLR